MVLLERVWADVHLYPLCHQLPEMSAQVVVTGEGVDRGTVDHDPQAGFWPFRGQVAQIRQHVDPILLLRGMQHDLEVVGHIRDGHRSGVLRQGSDGPMANGAEGHQARAGL